MFLSVFDIFKIGIGPSSSHTMGPMVAAGRFLNLIRDGDWPRPAGVEPARLAVSLHGSLAFTGKGHGSDRAILLGLMGESPRDIDPFRINEIIAGVHETGMVTPAGHPAYQFNPGNDLVFDFDTPLPGHANGMRFSAFAADGRRLVQQIYYSVGGGFVVTDEELARTSADDSPVTDTSPVPYPFASAREMLAMGESSGLSIAEMKEANELARGQESQALVSGLERIWDEMRASVERGLSGEGDLPGGLGVKRRARELHDRLQHESGANALQPHRVMDWLSVYAMAVNEENAAGGKIVTAPTNGAAGVVPAVVHYYLDHCIGASREGVRTFILTAAAIGGIIKHNASISGAEVGCQGEVGSASAMAAAGLAAALGATNAQIENAAEIALEHHLGMTCDPIAGLVQVPCIERNALGAVKAVTAASLAMRGTGDHFVPLDKCIETMRQTGRDMHEKYKETSKGGLAVNVIEC
ncbi:MULTISPECIES: L-serine ammonia-lyase [Afifella]|uniref:L-serine ammonia-lyase n=1 Tax=Afifella TaxID=643217 RepID=UPI000FE43C00|nr:MULTISPECIES: L-serine ammonia-lyase [Afifella]MCT8265976.1 L-serine ammonia-lyase [Afifella sp. JA880]